MLVIALTLVALIWTGVVAVVVAVCVSAARGDRTRVAAPAAPAPRTPLRLIA